MTSKSSKLIPFLVLFFTFTIIAVEGFTGIDYDLESYIPILITMGFGGGIIKIAKQISEAKKSIPTEIKQTIKEEVQKIKINNNP